MQYLERTHQVRAVLLGQPRMLDIMRSIFERLMVHQESTEGSGYWVGSGSSRDAFNIGKCDIDGLGQVSILLKIYNESHQSHRSWEGACGLPYKRLGQGSAEEFGAFEAYYDFIAGHIKHLSFGSKRKLERFNSELRRPNLRQREVKIPLDDWEGTSVAIGDLGAVPYFQMAIKSGEYFGWLTEGLPPIIEPKRTASHGDADENTIEGGRIIDLSANHCMLREINRDRPFGEDHRDHLGLLKRGRKYLLRENRIDL